MDRGEMKKILESSEENSNYRSLKSYEDKKWINLSSNDYLGLSEDVELKQEFLREFSNLPFSSGSSRLLTGSYPLIMELEDEVEKIYGKKALLFNSGYDLNHSVIETLFSENSLIISDRYNHASIYSGIKASGAKLLRFPHLDYSRLEKLLKEYSEKFSDILIISETVYSMDGDTGNLQKLIELKEKYGVRLMIDEAHSYGVWGYGMAYEMGLLEKIDYLSIPLGKGGASIGAYLLTDALTKEFLINRSRKFIYTTALPPINAAWNLFILRKMGNFFQRGQKLEALKEFVHMRLKEEKIPTVSDSHIISIIIGDNSQTDLVTEMLRERGYLLFPIKEPSVPKGGARLRISLRSTHKEGELNQFIKELKDVLNRIF